MAGALVPCVAAVSRLPLSCSDAQHRLTCVRGSALEAPVFHNSIWGLQLKSTPASTTSGSRCCCVNERDESFTTNGNVVLFDERAAELEDFIAKTRDKLVVLDISTKTCGPCKFIYPKLVKMSTEYPEAVFLKINGDHDSETRALMRKWKIRAVPSFKFFRNGEMIHSHSGAKEDDLRAYFLVHYTATLSKAS